MTQLVGTADYADQGEVARERRLRLEANRRYRARKGVPLLLPDGTHAGYLTRARGVGIRVHNLGRSKP